MSSEKRADIPDDEVQLAPPLNRRSRLNKRWGETVDTNFTDLICLLLCLNTGLCDSCAFNAWSCFLAMQTGKMPALQISRSMMIKLTIPGNTIVLGLGASHQPLGAPNGWARSIVSIAAFVIGAMTFARCTKALGARRRGTLFLSFCFQALLIIIAAVLIQTDVVQTQSGRQFTLDRPLLTLVPIALLAFQSAGSINSTRMLGFNEIPGVVLTSVYYDIASDAGLFDGISQNAKRNRRIGGVVMLLTGAIVGGWLSRTEGGMALVLWLAAALKFCAGVGWLFWTPA
ncbi:uncharacterized protein N7483_000412 [Penicillium malachiteum]|uniref:uncharacterized protein n=1 Tax=Penicillium malachiteum TaxID=1324776 RepID=UPI00254805A9|nr:uncharacterized protein N7483_000412 [Penicillium malachiteum]KAJ5735287.1 hypothetical protein N7483_000412 [Penicillium malachiteum]